MVPRLRIPANDPNVRYLKLTPDLSPIEGSDSATSHVDKRHRQIRTASDSALKALKAARPNDSPGHRRTASDKFREHLLHSVDGFRLRNQILTESIRGISASRVSFLRHDPNL